MNSSNNNFINTNKQANIDMWNAKSKNFAKRAIPSFINDSLLNLIIKENMISSNSEVLDVGCGTGQQAIALAQKCKKVVGIDLSPDMIKIAKEKANSLGITNVEFICIDFEELDIKNSNFYKKFDLSFANRSPAIDNTKTFQKLIETSKNWCLITKHKKEEESISNKLKIITSGISINEITNTIISDGFEFLLKNNYLPNFVYDNEKWGMETTFDEILSICIGDAKALGTLNLDIEKRLKNYLSSVSVNGTIKENIMVTIISMYWQI